jgi:hypothetical protein
MRIVLIDARNQIPLHFEVMDRYYMVPLSILYSIRGCVQYL